MSNIQESVFSVHDQEKILDLLKSHNEKAFRYTQIEHAIYKDLIQDWNEVTTLAKPLREILAKNTSFMSLTIHKRMDSEDGQTSKFLLKTHDDKMIECVIMRHLSGRNTLCVSCQAGCPMACVFCATGKLGLIRNLTFAEMVEQFMIAEYALKAEWKELRNVVFMGMWEPFLNYPQVKEAINILTAQKKLDLSSRRVTISSCGIVPGIRKFTEDFPQVSLAISLHAPNDIARSSIMPVDHSYPLKDLMASLDEYCEATNKRVFYEYIMISGVTDKLEYMQELADLLKGRLAHVNFIPYNPGEGIMGVGHKPTSMIIMKKFQQVLEKAWVPSTIRHTMGDDIAAACGQLALKEEKHDPSKVPEVLEENRQILHDMK